jgi:hypothetical protein
MTRRIIRIDGAHTTIAEESRFDSEAQLHSAIAAHPEVLPTEDLRMGPLVAIANELDLGAGPLDLLATDAAGRLVVIEFKRGSENPDVRKVVAQVLDYGSVLWRQTYEDLERRCRAAKPGFPGLLADYVKERFEALGEVFDADLFQTGAEACLETGNFVFLYVGRDLDERTRRIMTFLAEGARLTFFAVEVDHFRDASNASVMIPRTAFVPSWIASSGAGAAGRVGAPKFNPSDASPDVAALMAHMDDLAADLDLRVRATRSGRNYHPSVTEQGVSFAMGVGVYASTRGAEINLLALRETGQGALADALIAKLRELTGLPIKATSWPAVPCELLIRDWARTRKELLEPYFRARATPSPEG